jgi:hypothetical protein
VAGKLGLPVEHLRADLPLGALGLSHAHQRQAQLLSHGDSEGQSIERQEQGIRCSNGQQNRLVSQSPRTVHTPVVSNQDEAFRGSLTDAVPQSHHVSEA